MNTTTHRRLGIVGVGLLVWLAPGGLLDVAPKTAVLMQMSTVSPALNVRVGAVGDASVAKLAANLIGGITAIARAEAPVLGAKAGVAPAKLLEALRQSPVRSGTMDMRGPLMVSHTFDPHIRLDLFLKDFRLMLDEGNRLGVALP